MGRRIRHETFQACSLGLGEEFLTPMRVRAEGDEIVVWNDRLSAASCVRGKAVCVCVVEREVKGAMPRDSEGPRSDLQTRPFGQREIV